MFPPYIVAQAPQPAPIAQETVVAVAATFNKVLPYGRKTNPWRLPFQGLRVTTFNVHHLRGRDKRLEDGRVERGPGQFWEIVQAIREQEADVVLLQEVPPEFAPNLVQALHKDGYYSQAHPIQGNLILLPPGTVVTDNRRVLVNPNLRSGDLEATRAALEAHRAEKRGMVARQFLEPRSVQMLKVELAEGGELVLWNTHLTAGPENSRVPESPETLGVRRRKEAVKLIQALNEFAGQAPILGGGDLNSDQKESVFKEFSPAGFAGHPDEAAGGIDWILTRGLPAPKIVNNQTLFSEGIQISDHPILTVEFE